MSTRFLLAATTVVSMVGICSPRFAAAQQLDIEARYKAALKARDAGDYATACPQLEEIVRQRAAGTQDPSKGLGARLELATCYEKQGKLASAVEQYVLVQANAAAAGKKDREDMARDKLTALRSKVALLTVVVPAEVAALPAVSVSLDQKGLDRKLWGTPMPVDPGKHTVTVTATGRSTWERSGEVSANGARVSVEVQMPAPLAPPPSPPAAKPSPESEAGESPPASLLGQQQRPIGIGSTAAGAAGLLLGGVMGGLSLWKRDASNAGPCDTYNYCRPDGIALRNDALLFGNVSTVAFIAGGVLAVGGIVLLAMAPSSSNGSAGKTAEVRALPGGVAFVGRF